MKVLIDGNNKVFSSEWGKGLYYKGQRTSGILSFLLALRKLAKKYGRKNIIVCWDSATQKDKEYAAYKKNRIRDEMYYQIISEITALEEILRYLGVKQCKVFGYEADDLIADYVHMLKGSKLIVSTDGDMWQLISKDTSVLRGKDVITLEVLKDRYDLTPDEYLLKKMVVGDPSDNIKGIDRIGEKTFFKLLRESGSIEEFLEHPKICASRGIIERNYKLMGLERLGIQETKDALKDVEPDFQKFREQCFKYGLFSLLKRLHIWSQPFRLEAK